MDLLITPVEFAAFRDISKKIDDDKTNEAISLAQQSDLIDILGDFYFDVLKNATETAWLPLMDGSEFTYCDKEYEHVGIKALLADYTYARFIYMANVNLTPFGAQSKFTNDSEGIDRLVIKDLSKQAQVDAGIKFKYIRYYLLSDPELFSRYCESQRTDTPFNGQKFSIL